MKEKKNDEAYNVLWNSLNALEHLKETIDKEIDIVVIELKKYKRPGTTKE